MKRSKKNKGFTLIEIMVVVIILGTLIAIVAPNFIGRVGDAQITAAKHTIRSLESALRMYRLDNFNYPTTEQGINALVSKPIGQSARNWKGPYLDRVPDDPWGKKYQYMYPGINGEFDIFTYGRDRVPGGEGEDADIGNWMN